MRASFYRYELAPLGSGVTWRRTPAGQYLAPVSLDDPELANELRAYGIGD